MSKKTHWLSLPYSVERQCHSSGGGACRNQSNYLKGGTHIAFCATIDRMEGFELDPTGGMGRGMSRGRNRGQDQEQWRALWLDKVPKLSGGGGGNRKESGR